MEAKLTEQNGPAGAQQKGRVEKPVGYQEFLAKIRGRGFTISRLAKQLGRGRTHLNEVLMGRREGTHTWKSLASVLTAEEYEMVKTLAAAEFQRRSDDGKTKISGMVKLKEENEALRRELETLKAAHIV